MHLRTTMWILDERNATIQGSTSMVSAPSGLSEQTGPQNQKPSNLAITSKYNACTVCNSSHVSIMLGPFFQPVITLAVGSLHSRRKGNVDQSGEKQYVRQRRRWKRCNGVHVHTSKRRTLCSPAMLRGSAGTGRRFFENELSEQARRSCDYAAFHGLARCRTWIGGPRETRL